MNELEQHAYAVNMATLRGISQGIRDRHLRDQLQRRSGLALRLYRGAHRRGTWTVDLPIIPKELPA